MARIEDAVKDLKVGDTLMVPKGAALYRRHDRVGFSLIDEAISGESVPVEKTVGDDIFGSTINLSEALTMTVSKESKDTDRQNHPHGGRSAKDPSKTASFINRIENTYVKIVLVFVPVMIAVFYFLLIGLNESFYRGMVLICRFPRFAASATLSSPPFPMQSNAVSSSRVASRSRTLGHGLHRLRTKQAR